MWKIKSLLPCIVILLCCWKIVEIGMFFQMRWKWTIVLWLFRASSSGHLSCWAMAATPWTWASRGWICRPKSKTKFHFCTVLFCRVFLLFSILVISCLTMMFSRIYTHDWVSNSIENPGEHKNLRHKLSLKNYCWSITDDLW